MKSILFTLCFFIVSVAVIAQRLIPRVEFGANLSGMLGGASYEVRENDYKLGIRFGMSTEIKCVNFGWINAYVSPGIIYKMGGYIGKYAFTSTCKCISSQDLKVGESSVDYHIISLPVVIGTRISRFGIPSISIEAGSYISYAMDINSKSVDFEGNMIKGLEREKPVLFYRFFDEAKQWRNDKSLFKRFDAGLNASVALEVTRFYVRAGIEYGLVDQFNGDLIAELKKATKEMTDLFKDLKESNMTHISLFLTLGVRF